MLPGMHNARVEKFLHDAGDPVPDEKFFNTSIVRSKQRQVVQQETVDWWSLLKKFEQQGFKRINDRNAGPRSPFVEKLYRLRDDLMAAANGTTTIPTILPPPPSSSWDWRANLAKTPPDQPVDFTTEVILTLGAAAGNQISRGNPVQKS